MHDSAYADARRFVRKYLPFGRALRVADVGSLDHNGSLRPLFDNPKWTYIGLDVCAGKNVDVVLSAGYHWPEIGDGAFDVVVSTQVVEHVRHPWRWVKEVARICKPGGIVYLCTPNTIAFHEYPIDCWRVWPDGMRALIEEAGLVELEVYETHEPDKIGDTTGVALKPGTSA